MSYSKASEGKACVARTMQDCSNAGIQLWLLWHCSLSKHARDEHVAQLLSLQSHPIVRMHQKRRKKKRNNQWALLRRALLKRWWDIHSRDGFPSSPPPPPILFIFLFSDLLVFLLCLIAETFLPHYMREEAAIYCLLPVATNKFDTTFQAAPTYCLKGNRPSLQIQRPQRQVRGLVRSKSQTRGFLAQEQ